MCEYLHLDKCVRVAVWMCCRRLDGEGMAVFNKGEMCVFLWGMEAYAAARREGERERDGAEIEH